MPIGVRTPVADDAHHARATSSGSAAAVGVAEDEPVGAPPSARPREGRQGVLRVEPVAVEEVLGVVDDLLAQALEVARTLSPIIAQVLVRRRLEHPVHVQRRALADERDHRRLAPRPAPGGSRRPRTGAPARRVLPKAAIFARLSGTSRIRREELGVLRVGAGPAALDVAARPAGRARGRSSACPPPRATGPRAGCRRAASCHKAVSASPPPNKCRVLSAEC